MRVLALVLAAALLFVGCSRNDPVAVFGPDYPGLITEDGNPTETTQPTESAEEPTILTTPTQTDVDISASDSTAGMGLTLPDQTSADMSSETEITSEPDVSTSASAETEIDPNEQLGSESDSRNDPEDPPEDPDLPKEIPDMSEKIIAFNQNPGYPTGCESAALYILLHYYDVDVTMEQIVAALPKGPKPVEAEDGNRFGANPEREFVGDPTDWASYGVFNQPIAQTANRFLNGAIAADGLDSDGIEEILSEGIPLIVWISMTPEKEPKISNWYDYATGEVVTWLGGEHAVVFYGVADDGYKISDPRTGEKCILSFENFAIGLERYGGRAVYYPKKSAEIHQA